MANHCYLAGLTLALMLAADPAFSEGKFSPDSDILGFNLSMTRANAEKHANELKSSAKIVDVPVEVTMGAITVNTSAGFVVDLTDAQDAASNQQTVAEAARTTDAMRQAGIGSSPLNQIVGQSGDFGYDKVQIMVNPNTGSNDIFGITRTKVYSKQNPQITQTLIDSLIQKYGPPTSREKQPGGSVNLLWLQSNDSKLLERQFLTPSCAENSSSYSFEHKFNPGNISRDTETISAGLVGTTNLIMNNNQAKNYSRCKIVLNISIEVVRSDSAYVDTFYERLIDLTKQHLELKQFGDTLAGRADSERKEKEQSDSKRKTNL